MKTYKIIFFKGPLKTLNFFVDQLIRNAERNQINYLVADTKKPESYSESRLISFLNKDLEIPTVMVTMNQIGINYRISENDNFWKKNNVKVYDFVQDHPRNYDDVLLKPPCDIYVFSLDFGHIDFIHRFYPDIKNVYFVPNGGTEIIGSKPFEARETDVIYMGGCQQRIQSYPPIHGLPNNGAVLYKEVVECLISTPTHTTEQAMEEYFSNHNYSISENDLLTLHLSVDPYIENDVRRYFKLLGIQALDRAGVQVDIYGGNSWYDPDFSFSDNIRIHSRVTVEQIIKKLHNSKISLCFIPWFKRGCSEKNFDSMLNGALCVSDRSEYLDLHYKDGQNIVFFDLKNLDQMAADVKWLLEHLDVAEQIAKKGYDTAKEFDTWDIRSDIIFNIILRDIRSEKISESKR